MYNSNSPTFSLDNFEGPLELLLYLIQKDEIDICAITIKNLTAQFMDSLQKMPEVETSSEILNLAATLLLMKSRKLLPDEMASPEESEEESRIELIQSLIEYCRFRDAAKMLSLREEEQKSHFPRATPPFRKEVGSGLEEYGIDHLKSLMLEFLKKEHLKPKQVIREEELRVSDKLAYLQEILPKKRKIEFKDLFSDEMSRKEWIVLFLALLELMKSQVARVVKENEILYIICYESRA